ncbi:IS110 family transposase, partial [Pseudomonas otitidis]|nr:IS110 family transposase [Pseudomonas otitidis]
MAAGARLSGLCPQPGADRPLCPQPAAAGEDRQGRRQADRRIRRAPPGRAAPLATRAPCRKAPEGPGTAPGGSSRNRTDGAQPSGSGRCQRAGLDPVGSGTCRPGDRRNPQGHRRPHRQRPGPARQARPADQHRRSRRQDRRPAPGGTGRPAALANSRAITAFAGLNPRLQESGSYRGQTRISKMGSSRLRAGLYMPAISALTYNEAIRAMGERLRERGKT